MQFQNWLLITVVSYVFFTVVKPDNVVNPYGYISGHNLTVNWSAPNQSKTAKVSDYVIRWGFLVTSRDEPGRLIEDVIIELTTK